jgi:hypothetical protein
MTITPPVSPDPDPGHYSRLSQNLSDGRNVMRTDLKYFVLFVLFCFVLFAATSTSPLLSPSP